MTPETTPAPAVDQQRLVLPLELAFIRWSVVHPRLRGRRRPKKIPKPLQLWGRGPKISQTALYTGSSAAQRI